MKFTVIVYGDVKRHALNVTVEMPATEDPFR